MEETEQETEKPQIGTWDKMEGYPKKITFETDKPVSVVFDVKFEEPKEMPSVDGKGVYYIFECRDGLGDKATIMTSAWTLLNSLKSHMPLAGKNLIITKKNVKGKNMYYVNRPESFGTPVPEVNISEDEVQITDEDGNI